MVGIGDKLSKDGSWMQPVVRVKVTMTGSNEESFIVVDYKLVSGLGEVLQDQGGLDSFEAVLMIN